MKNKRLGEVERGTETGGDGFIIPLRGGRGGRGEVEGEEEEGGWGSLREADKADKGPVFQPDER